MANICFILAILSDVILALENGTLNKDSLVYYIPYSILALVVVGMTKSVKNFFLIGLWFFLVRRIACIYVTITLLQIFYEVVCFIILLYIPDSKYDILTMMIWLAKSLCKVPLYMELVVYYHKSTKLIMYLVHTHFLLFIVCPCYFLLYFLINKPNMLVIIIIMLTVTVTCIFVLSDSPSFTKILSFAFVFTEIISTYIIFRITQSFDILLTKFFSYLFFLILVGVTVYIGAAIEILKNTALVETTETLEIFWKGFSIFSVVIYLINILYYTSDLSFVLIALSFLVIILLFFIALEDRSAYAIALTIILFVSYNSFVLYKSWSSDSIVFHITQVTCQLTVIGAFLYTVGYNYGRKIVDYNYNIN